MAKIVDSTGWATPIGRVFLAFGSIEHAVYLALRDIPKSEVHKTAARLNLSVRIDLLLEILSSYRGEPYEKLVSALERVKELAKKRNIPAHNALVADFHETAGGDFLLNHVIASPHNTKHRITLDELRSLADDSEKLAGDLFRCLSETRHI